MNLLIMILTEISDNSLMGWLIGALATLVGLAVAIVTPILKLNKTITKLDMSVQHLSDQLSRDEKKIEDIEKIIEKHSDYLLIDKKRLDNHESRLETIDHKIGYDDRTNRDGN